MVFVFSSMDAIILVDKPAGITSAEVVRRVKRWVKPARVGHLGTLDPFATGVLPILVGEATKLAPMLEGGEKEYEGLIRLGIETDTLDRDGKVVREAPIPTFEPSALAQVAARFTGKIEQVPPVFSAIKRAGVPLYRLARRGEEVEPPAPRIVEIKRLTLEQADCAMLRFSALCSAGTYMRSLARDIGNALGTAAHLAELRRSRNGNFHASDAVALDRVLDALSGADPKDSLPMVSLSAALPDLPEVSIGDAEERRLRNGDSRALDGVAPAGAELFKVMRDGELIAIARVTSRVTATIVRVFAPSVLS